MPPTGKFLTALAAELAGHGTAAKACALYLLLAACLKARPDTNLPANGMITSILWKWKFRGF
jgi:hypothetical protein